MQKVRRSEVRETVEGFKSRIFDYRSRLTDYSHPIVTSLSLPFSLPTEFHMVHYELETKEHRKIVSMKTFHGWLIRVPGTKH